jgi:hypothetical protein
MKQTLYKYFTQREYAEQFLDGSIYFNSLGYFCDYEDEEVRGDKYEGTSVFRPTGGLPIRNITKGFKGTIPEGAFQSTVKLEEVFVLCASRSFTDELRDGFNAVVCVEITKIHTLCTRIRKALPTGSTFRNGAVQYYDAAEGPGTRWPQPELIAKSKVNNYRWQDEYRFFFSPTNALAFENVTTQIILGQTEDRKPVEHNPYIIQARSLRDFCRLHELRSAELPPPSESRLSNSASM